MKRLISVIIFILLLGLVGYSLLTQRQDSKPKIGADKISIYASIYPLSFFAGQIGQDKVLVNTVTPPGMEPHEYDLKPGDLASIYNSKLLILNGANMEPWAERIRGDLISKGISVITTSDGVDLLTKDGHPDPHTWLDPVSAQKMVLNIRDGLVSADPTNEEFYRKNSDKLIVKLIDLDNLYKKSLYSCKQDTIVASHSVFGYLEKRYGFKQSSLAGLSPDEEPSSQKIAELVKLINQRNIKYILTETLLSPKLSETLAQETGASVQVFNPLESLSQEELDKNEDYFSIQEVNRLILAQALQCTLI